MAIKVFLFRSDNKLSLQWPLDIVISGSDDALQQFFYDVPILNYDANTIFIQANADRKAGVAEPHGKLRRNGRLRRGPKVNDHKILPVTGGAENLKLTDDHFGSADIVLIFEPGKGFYTWAGELSEMAGNLTEVPVRFNASAMLYFTLPGENNPSLWFRELISNLGGNKDFLLTVAGITPESYLYFDESKRLGQLMSQAFDRLIAISDNLSVTEQAHVWRGLGQAEVDRPSLFEYLRTQEMSLDPDALRRLINITNDSGLKPPSPQSKRLKLICTDGGEWIEKNNGIIFSFIFADTWPGKYSLLERRYSFVDNQSPDFVVLAAAYRIPGKCVSDRADLLPTLNEMLQNKGSLLLEVMVTKENNVFPMVPHRCSVSEIRLKQITPAA